MILLQKTYKYYDSQHYDVIAPINTQSTQMHPSKWRVYSTLVDTFQPEDEQLFFFFFF